MDNIGLLRHLRPHPSTRASQVTGLRVSDDILMEGCWRFRFHLEASLDDIKIAKPAEIERADDLWKTTCFEAFVRRAGDAEYLEFNFSPSGRWAAYHFAGYRRGMRALEIATPQIEITEAKGMLKIDVIVKTPEAWLSGRFAFGLSAIVEDKDGGVSYWALAHPPGRPDFHHKDCFALKQEAPRAA